jgi:hypothetical protein
MINDIVETLISKYWDIAIAEGAEGRTSDNKEGGAQQTLNAIRSEFTKMQARINELEKENNSLVTRAINCEKIFSDAPYLEFSKFKEMFPDEFEAHNLTQQAKGINDAVAKVKYLAGRNGFGLPIYGCKAMGLEDYANKLIQQSEESSK